MKRENTYSPISCLFSKQLNLSDFGFEKRALKEINKDIKPNKLLKFIKYVFKYYKSKTVNVKITVK